jgi:hypothetical protein
MKSRPQAWGVDWWGLATGLSMVLALLVELSCSRRERVRAEQLSPAPTDAARILDDTTHSIVTAQTVHADDCSVERNLHTATPDISIRVERECIVANNFDEFGMRLSFYASGEDVERAIFSSKIDNIIAFAQLGKKVLAIASVRHLDGRLFELTRGDDGWSSRVLTTLPGDVLRIGEDEQTRDVVLVVNDQSDRSPACGVVPKAVEI